MACKKCSCLHICRTFSLPVVNSYNQQEMGMLFWLIKADVIINFYQIDASVSFPKAFPTNFMYIFLIISYKLYI